jgi:FkbM family methyltransferase
MADNSSETKATGTGEPPRSRSRRTVVLAVIAVLAVAATVFADDGGNVRLARCLLTGDGFGTTVIDGKSFEADYFGHRYEGNVDNLIDIQIRLYGAYERPVLFAMRDVLAERRPDGDGVAVDVGANVGTHTLFLANHAETVHAFEPWPTVLKRLVATIEGNELKNVVVHPVGLAAEQGSLPFHVPPGFNLGWGSFSDTYAGQNYESDVIQLPLVRGDDYLIDKQVERIDVVKIDIEGYERPALEGMSKVLERDRPAVFFELNVLNDEGFHDEAQMRATFPEGYVFFEVATPPEFAWRLPGDRIVMCGHEAGEYRFVPFDHTYGVDGRNVVAMPGDLADKVTGE